MVKNPCNAGDSGLIPDPETKSPHVGKQLSLCTTMTEPALGLYNYINKWVCHILCFNKTLLKKNKILEASRKLL